MARKTFTNYKGPVDSFPLGEKHMGIFKPGRYNGYDQMITRGALDIGLRHSGKVKKTGTDNNYAASHGVLLFGTGTILHDDTQVDLVVETNSGNGFPRTDYIIAQNTYQEVAGGTPTIYSVIKGAVGTADVTPYTPDPKQVLIGRITIEANGYTFAQLKYTPELSPLLGDISYTEFKALINSYIEVPEATEEVSGKSKIATQTEVDAGVNDKKLVTPKTLQSKKATSDKEGIVRFATDTELVDGTDDNLAISSKQYRALDAKVPLEGNYELKKADWGKIFLGNGANTVEVLVTKDLGKNAHFGFIAINSMVKLVADAGVQISVADGKAAETKQFNSAILLEWVDTNKYVVLGNLKNV